MAENTLQTRILLRYGTFSQWMNSNVILKQGEVAVAVFPHSNNIAGTDTEPDLTPPAVGLKIGDGLHYFDELPWVQGIAADVYNWAKQIDKPSYSANEISGLAAFIEEHGDGGSGGGASSSAYRIVYNSQTSKYILQKYDDSISDWVDTTSEIDLSSILNRINTIERWANGAMTKLGNIEVPLAEYVYEEVVAYLNQLNYNDQSVEHQFVTSVVQTGGNIEVIRSIITASDITSGVLSTERGGTGIDYVDEDELLVGSQDGTLTIRKFVTELEGSNRRNFATVGAIKDYVDEKTEGLTGAMHFVGEATVTITTDGSRVDPQITGYNFRYAQPGDVILANNAQEFVWTGTIWRLLGDEGSYAIKGNIRNADIHDDAAIAQSKIDGLEDALDEKVDKVEGKQLSTNDYTTEEKEKLSNIADNAQENVIEHIAVNDVEVVPNNEKTVNLQIPVLTEEQLTNIENAQENTIEHIFVNGTEVNPSTISNQPKSVNIAHVMTEQEVEKLTNIETEAQVNKVETISFNGGEPLTPDNNKNIDITIDASALHLTVLEGARYPSGNNAYTSIEKDSSGKILELSKVAATGNIDHLVQENTYIILNCGTSTTVV